MLKESGADCLYSVQAVPFAIEERSGVITVVDELKKFERSLYDFEAVVADEREVNIVTNVTIHVVDPQDVTKPFSRYVRLFPYYHR